MIKKFSLVVWNEKTGDFNNARVRAFNSKLAEELFEMLYGSHLKVIHVFEGDLPDKTFRSLSYLN